MPIKHKCC